MVCGVLIGQKRKVGSKQKYPHYIWLSAERDRMKLLFCNKCHGTNVLELQDLYKENSDQYLCQICGRSIPDLLSKDIIDTEDFKLLIIDDEKGFLQIMEELMAKDYSVTTASNGRDGFDLAIKIQPDLIFLDIGLPDNNGYELCRSIKEHDATCHIPIIFVTSHDHDIEEQKGFDVGAVDYITKPVVIQVLKAKIAIYVRMKQISVL